MLSEVFFEDLAGRIGQEVCRISVDNGPLRMRVIARSAFRTLILEILPSVRAVVESPVEGARRVPLIWIDTSLPVFSGS